MTYEEKRLQVATACLQGILSNSKSFEGMVDAIADLMKYEGAAFESAKYLANMAQAKVSVELADVLLEELGYEPETM